MLDDLPLAGTLVATDFDGWPEDVRRDFTTNAHNGRVGTHLLAETGRARIWEITLASGERVPAHRHVLDYFWTALDAGHSRQHTHDGTTRDVTYTAGETRSYHFAEGEYLLHDLQNTGPGPLRFITVEFLDSANAPLPLSSE